MSVQFVRYVPSPSSNKMYITIELAGKPLLGLSGNVFGSDSEGKQWASSERGKRRGPQKRRERQKTWMKRRRGCVQQEAKESHHVIGDGKLMTENDWSLNTLLGKGKSIQVLFNCEMSKRTWIGVLHINHTRHCGKVTLRSSWVLEWFMRSRDMHGNPPCQVCGWLELWNNQCPVWTTMCSYEHGLGGTLKASATLMNLVIARQFVADGWLLIGVPGSGCLGVLYNSHPECFRRK